jgi:ABC-2 type transport system permease protein
VTRLLRGELIKVRSTRTALGFGAASVLLVIAFVLLTSLAADPETLNDKRDALNVGGALAIPLLVFGIVGATGEFRHRTLAPAVLIAPDRVRLTVARLAAYVLTALAVCVAMLVAALVIGVPILAGQPGPDLGGKQFVQVIGGGLLAVGLVTALGVGIGVLVRNQVAAVVGILVWIFIVEPLIPLLSEDVASYGILNSAGSVGVGGGVAEDAVPFAASLAALASWALVFVVAGVLVDRRRDVE